MKSVTAEKRRRLDWIVSCSCIERGRMRSSLGVPSVCMCVCTYW